MGRQLDALHEPPQIEVLNGEVVLIGPRVALTLTADAAAETARLLAAAAAEAQTQYAARASGFTDFIRRVEND